jgi:hypothetical protein
VVVQVHCSKILFIKQGFVCEEGIEAPNTQPSRPNICSKLAVGTHEQLLAKRGLYFDLASKTQQAK